jgi:hypothetical protein
MDALASAPAFGKMAYDQLVAALRPASEPITFVPLDEYRASLDDDTWELYTRQKLVNPAMVKHREMRWSDGTAVIGRVDASQPWVPSRYPESEEEVEEVEKPRSRKQRMKKLAKRLIGRA